MEEMDIGFCKKCGEYVFESTGSCKCREYKVYHRDYMEDDPITISASSHCDAAMKYAKHFWEDDPMDPNDLDENIEVEIRGDRKYFHISAEPDILFHANELKAQ